ncbi:MAG: glycosyltransferase [Clostridiales bacterium]|nr:glycosyltransferase [Clostridiales bacterium]
MGLKEYPKFSVAMSTYKNDDPEQLKVALDSVCTQSLLPNEVYLVVDGPISEELDEVINEYQQKYDFFTVTKFEKNVGRGKVLNNTFENCKYDLIAIMDSDDISAPGRFKKQLDAYLEEPCDVLGGRTIGFVGDLYTTTKVSASNRKLTHEEILKRLPFTSPISHVTALMRREAVLKAGNYLPSHYHEDYYLWARMAHAGCTFRNIPDYLVYVRLGENQARRHGGLKYFKAECDVRKYMLSNKLSTFPQFFKALAIRFVYQIVLPPSVRNWASLKFKRRYITREQADAIINKNIEDDKSFR